MTLSGWLLLFWVTAFIITVTAIGRCSRSDFDSRCKAAHGVTVEGFSGLVCLTDQPVIAEQ